MRYSNQKPNAPSVKWYAHQVTLEEVKSDVLIILDCCSAGGSGGDTAKGTKEVIAACGFETWAPGVGQHSFTKSLIDELKYLSTGPSFSASSLHSRVLDRLKHWNPVYNAEGLSVQDSNGRYHDKERRKTPVYISLNKDSNCRSIEIGSLMRRSRSDERIPSRGQKAVNDGSLDGMAKFLKDERFEHIEVTLSVQVEAGQILRPEDMTDWIKAMPVLAKSVKLHAAIPSFSTLLLLSVPVAVWNLLPEHPACSFVGFTRPLNLRIPAFSRRYTSQHDAKKVSSAASRPQRASNLANYTHISVAGPSKIGRIQSVEALFQASETAKSQYEDSLLLDTGKKQFESFLKGSNTHKDRSSSDFEEKPPKGGHYTYWL